MRHMCLSRLSKAVGHLRAHPLTLGVARELSAAGDASGAPLRLAEPRSAQDGCEVSAASASLSAALAGRPAGAPLDRLVQQLGGSCGTGCSSTIVRHQNPSSSCCGVCDTSPASSSQSSHRCTLLRWRLTNPATACSSPRSGIPRQPMIGARPMTSCASEQPYRAEPLQPAHFSPLPRRHRYASTAIAEVSRRASHSCSRPARPRACLTAARISTPSGSGGSAAGWRNARREAARGPRRRFVAW